MLMPATTVPSALASSRASSPRISVASVASSSARTVGATSTGSSGIAHNPDTRVVVAHGRPDARHDVVQAVGVGPG